MARHWQRSIGVAQAAVAPPQRRVFAWLLAVAAFLFLWTLSPIWVPVFLGVLLTVAVIPWQRRVVRRWPRHPRLLAAALTAVSLTVILAVLGYIAYIVARELIVFLQGALERLHDHGIAPLYTGHRGEILRRLGFPPERVNASLHDLASSALGDVTAIAERILSFASTGLLTLLFTAITSYYLLIDGERLLAWLVTVVPLPQRQTRQLIREFNQASRAILLGTGVTAAYQGVLAGIGFWIFHVSTPIVWGALTAVASLVPAVGTALVWIPVGVVEIAVGHTVAGIAVLLWNMALVVGVADYVIRPRILENRIRLHSLLVFIAIFGGIEAFGLLGVVLGPLFVALFVAILRIYVAEYRPTLPLTQ